jgi:hypothetical protein
MGFETGKFSLTTAVYDDTQQNALGLRDVGANIPTLTQVGSSACYLPQYDVDDAGYFCIQLPHTLKEAATVSVTPHVHWFSDSDSANVVRWEIVYKWVNNDADLPSDSAAITVDGTPDANHMQISAFAAQTKSGALISSIFMGRLRRITNSATDYSGNVFLAFFDLHFEVDTHGSDAATSKSYPS